MAIGGKLFCPAHIHIHTFMKVYTYIYSHIYLYVHTRTYIYTTFMANTYVLYIQTFICSRFMCVSQCLLFVHTHTHMNICKQAFMLLVILFRCLTFWFCALNHTNKMAINQISARLRGA